jgi:hypothetical protein
MTVQEQLETAVALLEEIRLGQRVNKNHPVVCTHPSEVPDPEHRFRCGWCRRLDVFLASLKEPS